MTHLMEICDALNETNAAISRIESLIREHPEERPLQINLQSLAKRQQSLEARFLQMANDRQVEVCSYRLVSPADDARPTAMTLAHSLQDFQRWLAVVYDALRSGTPKSTAHLSAEAVAETSLQFAYSYPGSVGMVFMVPAERLLFDEGNLARAAGVVAEMSASTDEAAVSEWARELGPAPVRALYEWADHHARSGFAADVEWRRGNEVLHSFFVQQPGFESVRSAITAVKETTSTTIELVGEIRAADLSAKTFKLLLDNDSVIRGRFDDAIDQEHTVELPKRYSVTLRQTVTIHYSSEEPTYEYFLERLEPA